MWNAQMRDYATCSNVELCFRETASIPLAQLHSQLQLADNLKRAVFSNPKYTLDLYLYLRSSISARLYPAPYLSLHIVYLPHSRICWLALAPPPDLSFQRRPKPFDPVRKCFQIRLMHIPFFMAFIGLVREPR